MRYRTENQITLVWIRHGETKANQEQRYLGRTDEDLSEKGIETLLSYKKQNFYPKVTHLFTSPMKRCVETGAVLYPELSPVVIPEWREMDFGQFEYKNYEELKDDVRYQAWIDSGGALDFPGGESRENFILRCEKGAVNCSNWPVRMGKKPSGQALSFMEARLWRCLVHTAAILILIIRFPTAEVIYAEWKAGRSGPCQGKNVCG